jgi:integrase
LSRTLNPSDVANIDWVLSFESGRKWFDKLRSKKGEKPGREKNYSRALRRFADYMKMNPDEIMNTYKADLKTDVNAAVEKWNENLDLYPLWLQRTIKVQQSTSAAYFQGVKSFFKYNAAIKLTAQTPQFYSEALKPVTLEDLREKILPLADIFQTFETVFFKDSGISQDDALRLTVGSIKDVGDGFGYISTTRMKEFINYETFVGPNTTDALKKLLEYRQRRGENTGPNSPLFVKRNKPFNALTPHLIQGSFQRLTEKSGIEISTHRLRKTFETYLATAKVHPVVIKYWAGHKVKGGKTDIEARYVLPSINEQQKMYKEAYHYLDISPKLSAEELSMERIRSELSTMNPESAKSYLSALIKRYASRPDMKRMLEDVQKEFTENTDCLDDEHCEVFEQINEGKLLDYLRSGWTVEHRLQNGDVIVKKQ